MALKAISIFAVIILGNLYTCNYEKPMPRQSDCDGVFFFGERFIIDFKDPNDNSWYETKGYNHLVERITVYSNSNTEVFHPVYESENNYTLGIDSLIDNREYYIELNENDLDTFHISTFNHTDSCYSYKVLDTLTYNGTVIFINDRVPLYYKRFSTIEIKKDYSYP